MFKTTPMAKIRITGLKSSMKATIDILYALKIMHLVDFSKNGTGFLDIGTPFMEAKELSESLVKIDSIVSFYGLRGKPKKIENFYEAKKFFEKVFEEFSGASAKIASAKAREAELRQRLADPMNKIKIDRKYLREYDNISVFTGITKKQLGQALQGHEIQFRLVEEKTGENYAIVLFVQKKDTEKARTILLNSGFSEQAIPEGFSEEKILEELAAVEKETLQAKEFLEKFGKKNSQFLLAYKFFLRELNEKAETPLRFGVSQSTFVATGFVPKKTIKELKNRLESSVGETVHIDFSDSLENAPIKLNNPKIVKPFELFLDLYTMPSYREIDPSFLMAITFPIFFGFMLGDVGYGIIMLAIFGFLAFKAKGQLKGFSRILIWSALSSVFFGFVFGELFGAEFIEPLLNRVHEPTQVLGVAIAIGFVHINIGLLVGFYNELKNHGLKKAILAKLGWIAFESGIVLLALDALQIAQIGMIPGAIVVLVSIAMLYMGEGARGLVELPSIFSNMLSYSRLFAVGLSSVSIALVVNQMAGSLWEAGIVGMIGAIVILVIGHILNTALGLLGCSLHSLRLHYVEFFGKFFKGGGQKFVPFGQIKEN
ncbi:MAG: V-type ATP synthase subunit I [Candidatus ainarchaeum sp.]|nr:V-type ATP synthase subunit I [Candidatus ainarchaeum sp.]